MQSYLRLKDTVDLTVPLHHFVKVFLFSVLIPVNEKKIVTEEESWKCLVINRSDGVCRSFNSPEQINTAGTTVCLDSVYNVLWR